MRFSENSSIQKRDFKFNNYFSRFQSEDPFNIINRVLIEKGKIKESSTKKIPWYAFSYRKFDKKEPIDKRRKPRRTKIHPLLRKWVRYRSGKEREQLIVNFVEDIIIPRFPELDASQKRDSDKNKELMAEAEKLVKEIKERRNQTHKKWIEDFGSKHQIRFIESFWLINAILVEMPLEAVPELAKRDDVSYIEPRYAGEKPPQNTNANDDVDDGRGRINSDPYFNLGQTSGYIGLLDTGIRDTHTLFTNPSNIDFKIDCTGANNPDDDSWNHGTSSAAILSGNGNLGNAFRGVTAITLDSFKIYTSAGLDSAAAVEGFQKAVSYMDRVIVAEIQGSGDDYCSISQAADNAYDAGAVVIAANGNAGPSSHTVNAPAIAHRVIGVGCYDVQSQNQISAQSRGPAPDNRYKPDIQAPTETETASNTSNTALKNFINTSGATPYAAGGAALLRNWLRGSNFSIDPGQVYAQIILSGQNAYPFNNTSGAGSMRLPTDGVAWWSKVSVIDKMTIDIPLNIDGTYNTFDAALWWPDLRLFGSYIHNDIDLYLIDPAGTIRDFSYSGSSVFERARVSGNVTNGTWKVRIVGYDVIVFQTVYLAAAAHMLPP